MKRIYLLCLIALLLAACQQGNNEVLDAIDTAEAQWQAVGINSYALATAWQPEAGEAQLVQVIVIEGEVADVLQDCQPAGACEIMEIDPARYTVEGLFAQAREQNDAIEEITFDAVTGALDVMLLSDGRVYESEIDFGGFAPR